jgi:hypothetical protein
MDRAELAPYKCIAVVRFLHAFAWCDQRTRKARFGQWLENLIVDSLWDCSRTQAKT